MDDQRQLQSGITALEAQRAVLGDAVVDTALASLRAKLAALQSPGAEPRLKQVTVLFADVVGSTSMSQQLDAEDTHAVINGALERCRDVVGANGGRVFNYMGDGLLAAFGADGAREDDPERAVRAGLAIIEEAKWYGAEVQHRHGIVGFNMRVGINTGPALLGGGVEAGNSAMGATVNIAARMEQTAPPGGLRISHDTYRHVRGVFDVEAQPPLLIKGRDEPVVTYLVQRAKPRAFRVAARGIEGVETRMVGRDAELERLQEAFRSLYGDPKLGIVTVVAEAGLGKSRLLYEFENWVETRPERFHLFEGRAYVQTHSQPFALLRDILARRLSIADSDSMHAAKQKIEDGIAPLFVQDDGEDLARGHAHLLGHLIGLDFHDSEHVAGILEDGRQIRNRGFHAAAQMFRRVAAADNSPVVLLLDDLQWADDGSLDFLDYLGQVNRDVPMLMLGLTRPTLFERRPDWARGTGIHGHIKLEPLDKGGSRELAEVLLQKLDEIPAVLRELVSGGAEGNPYYMEELVKMLVDEGAIVTGAERWELIPAKLMQTHVPQALTGLLQARLDTLAPTEKLALQQASAVGFVFWDQALAAIDAGAAESLPALVRRELVMVRETSAFDGMREYAFRHHILHQVTYDTLLKGTRRGVHAKVAAWLAASTGTRVNAFLGVIAEHFEKANDTTNACEYFARAADDAVTRFAHEASSGYVAKALALTDDGDLAMRWRLFALRERELDVQGIRVEQAADIATMHTLAEALDDDARRADVAWRRCDLAFRTGDYRAAEAAARQSMALAEHAGAALHMLRAQHMLVIALQSLGDTAAAGALALEGLASSREQRNRRMESRFINALAVISSRQTDLVAGHEFDKQVLLICRELGDRRDETVALANLGLVLLSFGEFAQAKRHLDESLRLARATGTRFVEPHILRSLSALAAQQGDAALALAHAKASVELAIAVQDLSGESVAQLCLADAELALGHHAEAARAYERTRELCRARKHPIALDAEAGLARVALAQGDVARAMTHAQALLGHLAEGGDLDGTDSEQLIRLSCYRVLQSAGDARAAAVLTAAHAELQAEAAAISDAALRESYLTQIAEHREVVATWAAMQAT